MDHPHSYLHRDNLQGLNETSDLKARLTIAHEHVRARLPFIARIALTLYDPATGRLRSFVHSGGEDDPLSHYEAAMADSPSLQELIERGRPRVINNMLTFEDGDAEHTRRIARHGYAASYTLPVFCEGRLLGFLFFNSRETDVFTEEALQILDVYGHMIALMVINEVASIGALTAAVKTAGHITHLRDPETGSHLDRMSRYSQLIARGLADRYELDDEYIEHVFMYAPLHDIGKIAIPDRILLKPAKLTDQEMEVMRTHAERGREMIDQLVRNFGFEGVARVDILRNIASFHHEAVNGSGYPEGRRAERIPLEARIVAVADVFDALTSKRPYKEAWSIEDAFATLESLAGEHLDRECVEALITRRDEVEAIRRRFSENLYG